jgi:tRNA modification GTPase
MEGDTIVALSTPPGESGIAVVRMSGPDAISILGALAPGPRRLAPRKIYRKTLRDASGEAIDDALVFVSRAPASYTGEDMVEISCHGGMQVVADLIEEITSRGARIAAPGEFTKRAFLNGRIDLAQAEAVADLIAAETRLQRRLAVEHLEGSLTRRVRELEAKLLEELALVEASIDFAEEDIPPVAPEALAGAVGEIRGGLGRLLESEVAGSRLRHGLRVTILGPRNAGKSSLYNALIGEERAIVSPVPGTTRDVLRERLHIGGFTCHIEDTAGIAQAQSEIEAAGIRMGRAAAGRADLVLFVIDGSVAPGPDTRDEIARMDRARTLCVLNKEDIGLALSAAEALEDLGVGSVVSVSALRRTGLEALKEWIVSKAGEGGAGDIMRERIAINSRQAEALREADAALARVEAVLAEGGSPEIVSLEMRGAAEGLGKISGRSVAEDILEAIFSRFCVGK